jgi:glyceraldehyde 3-phosphate dehydrogenase
VPVPDGSVVDLFVQLAKRVTADDVHSEIRAAAESNRMKSILQFVADPVVSSDINGNAHSSIVDAGFTSVTGEKYLKCLSWYDNEWGYSNRVCDLLNLMAQWK